MVLKAVSFDLDNTLIDFFRMKRIACERVLEAMIDVGLKVENFEETFKKMYNVYLKEGIESNTWFTRFLKETNNEVKDIYISAGVNAYQKARDTFLDPYPNVIPVLINLIKKGIKLAIISDAPKLKVLRRLHAMKLYYFFDTIVAFEDTNTIKSSKKPFEVVIKKLKVKPKEMMHVGDWPIRDIDGAKAVGIKTVFAKYGAKGLRQGYGKTKPDYEIEDINELVDIVDKLK